MFGLSPAQIRSFANEGFLQPERGERGELRFGFHDLILLRTASELTAAEIPRRKVRRALRHLRDQLPEGQSLTAVRIAADGERVVVRDGSAVWNPESGQSLFNFAVDEIASIARHVREDERSADHWFELGCELEESSAQEAIEAYEQALRLDPDHTDAHVNLGRLLHEDGAPAAAEHHYRAALEVDAAHETATFNLGVALEDLGHLNEAIEMYKHALTLDPDNADAHYNLAGIYERRGDKAAALRHMKSYAKMQKGA